MHIEPEINYLLLWHLNQYKWIELPGFGIWRAQEQKAYIDHRTQHVFPSALSVQFDPIPADQTANMIDHMELETGYAKSDLENKLADLCLYLSESIRKKGTVFFEPYGNLSKKNDEMYFEAQQINLHDRFFGLKELALQPLVLNYNSPETYKTPIIPITNKKSRSKEFRYLFIALGIFWLIFILLLMCPSGERKFPEVEQNPIKPLTQETIIKEPVIHDQKTPLTNQDTQVIASRIPENKLTIADTSFTNQKEFQKEISVNEKNIKEINQLIQNKPCVIIVGSFKKINNANRLAKTLTRKKYKVYREPYLDFHRVGVQFDCLKKDLQTVLSELKTTFNPDCWILKY